MHDRLTEKLAAYGFSQSLLFWIADFFYKRTQVVKECFVTSPRTSVTSSIIQGSSFTPTLFIGFINDINSVIKSSKLYLLVDDVKILKGIRFSSDHHALQENIRYSLCFVSKMGSITKYRHTCPHAYGFRTANHYY